MTAPYSAIRSAFVTRLQAFPGLPSVAWENVPFPGLGVAMPDKYIVPVLLPGEPFQAEQGENGQNWHPGIYQISLYYTTKGGIDAFLAMQTLRDGLIDHFKRGTVLTYSGISVQIQKAFPGPVIQETDWQHLPITIRYSVRAAN